MTIVDGKKLSKEMLEEIKKEVSRLSFVPVFCDVLVGSDSSSVQYVNLKKKIALFLGIKFQDAYFEENITTEELITEVEKLNKLENMCGLIVQLPLPEYIDTKKVLAHIDTHIDVDCLGENASNIFYKEKPMTIPPTAGACMYLLDSLKIDLKNKNIVVFGAGDLVGKPVSRMLDSRNLPHNVIDRKTESKNKEKLIKNADVIISGIGVGGYIKSDMIKEGVIIIDAGTSESSGSIVGDVDFDSVKDKVSFISPVPGGVGPVTVAMLFRNVLQIAKHLHPSPLTPSPSP
ncbi:MAG: Bifunctional protein FolD [Candidatus Nomurabacteria bacterium GW2011_GWA2_40_9]|uniref:Bifunctional protein FolD n=1 Tax=Candidatus Nomurabacteria bacterium GW2011_GWA2_40_9 TaxID=1618734 RepID=A0A0G0TRY8_9BACT|nr:MAG: Bifunctional protein FolD [Candidatus Nomurabacteria bacterium GW2011_GWA2_40_9]